MEIRRRIYIPFERNGKVRAAFAARGWFAVSCDLEPTTQPCGYGEYHHIGDARDLLDPEWLFGVGWDAMIAFPPCTYLCGSGWHWTTRDKTGERMKKSEAARDMFLLFATYKKIPLRITENPIGKMSTWYRKPDQIIQPWQFGHDASKATCLWIDGEWPTRQLKPTQIIAPRIVAGKKRWANQTDSGQNKLGPSAGRSDARSETYDGIACALADQMGR